MEVTQQQASEQLYRQSFDAFAYRAFNIVEPGTNYEWNWHMGCIAEHLQACRDGEIKRLIINIPPRSLKSYLVARAFPAWVLGQKPDERFICVSYAHQVVEQNSVACRRIITSPWYKNVFPGTVISKELNRATHYETTQGGQYYAASSLSPVTGIGCNYMIVDDPIRPMEAASETVRKSTNDNIRGTMFSRFNDSRIGRFIIVMQRVHDNDPTGNLLADGGWTHLKLPAETKNKIIVDLRGKHWEMQPGELLFPARLSKEILADKRRELTEYNYVGQFLQEPAPPGGGEFKNEWPQYYNNGSIHPKQMNIYIIVDAAGGDEIRKKKKKTSDFTAMMVVGTAGDNNYYLLDVIRDRLNPTERIDTLFMLHRKWNELAGKPAMVGYEKYGLMTDTHYIEKKQDKDGYHFPLIELGGKMIKEERIRRLIPDLQNKRWYFPHNLLYVDEEGRKFDLIDELVNSEMANFPRASFDDMLDALSRIYDADLGVLFPSLKQSMVSSTISMPRNEDEQSWEDF